MNILSGWQIDKNLGVFRIPIRITHPITKLSVLKYCLFDSGFSGYLGLDKAIIKLLGLTKIGQGKGLTVTGLIEYENFEGIIEIVSQDQKVIGRIINKEISIKNTENIIIPIQEFDIPIIGIKSILQFSWLLLSDKKAIFLLK